MLWLALIFPRLPLEAQSERMQARRTAAGAFVVAQGRVEVVDEAAEAVGVMPGMRLSTARGLLPEGRVVERDARAQAREQAALDELACFCGRFASTVCEHPPAGLLLEIGASLRLFGGVGAIAGRLREGCRERGFGVRLGVAPTPRAAEWLALAANGEAACCLTTDALPDMLSPLPVDVLATAPGVHARLRTFGLRRIGDLAALPRGALARRIGAEPVGQLAQAFGEWPDPRVPRVFPERFVQAVELMAPASDAAMLTFPARRLIDDLCGWLAQRQAGADACVLHLLPERRALPPLMLELRLASPSRDPERFLRLLRERLDRACLPGPVGHLRLEATSWRAMPGEARSLLEARTPTMPLDELVERLRARLGDAAVHGLRAVAGHRPECASAEAPVGFAAPPEAEMPALRRPLELFDPPEAPREIGGRPARGLA